MPYLDNLNPSVVYLVGVLEVQNELGASSTELRLLTGDSVGVRVGVQRLERGVDWVVAVVNSGRWVWRWCVVISRWRAKRS